MKLMNVRKDGSRDGRKKSLNEFGFPLRILVVTKSQRNTPTTHSPTLTANFIRRGLPLSSSDFLNSQTADAKYLPTFLRQFPAYIYFSTLSNFIYMQSVE